MIAVATVALAFAPTAPLQSRTAVRSMPQMSAEGDSTRRDLFAKAGAALLSFSAAVQGASAKAGQSGKIGIFDTSISSPYQPQGIARTEAGSTYGWKSNGEAAATGYAADVAREKASFQESVKRISGLGPKIESKTWWFVRDELRIQAYTMRASMLAMNAVNSDKKVRRVAAAPPPPPPPPSRAPRAAPRRRSPLRRRRPRSATPCPLPLPHRAPSSPPQACESAYKTFWKEIESLDLACKKKEPALAAKEFGDVLAAMKAYSALV